MTTLAFLLVIVEKKIVYHPIKYPGGIWNPENYGLQVEDIYFDSSDGVKLHAWFVPAKKPIATLLWYHGNAGNLSHRLENILELAPLNLNIFIFDYRGYGRSEGKANEKGLYLDSQAAYDFLRQNKKIDPDELFLFGRSLGGACAIEIASRNKAAGLIIESAFTSVSDMADNMFNYFPFKFLLRSNYNSIKTIPLVNMPKMFIHGADDEMIPMSMGRKLFEASQKPKIFYEIKGASHNDTYSVGGQKYIDSLRRFVLDAPLRKNSG
ncbi:MAG: alpha/beta hydrolase [Nitrospinales bacterium]